MVQAIQRRLGERFGLKPREGWDDVIEAALRRHAGSGDEATARTQPFGSVEALRELAGQLTVKESYFFRQRAHFDRIAELVAPLARPGAVGAPVRIWSAGCAGGEEPYTLAILLQERLGRRAARHIRILASDVNREAIERARAGRFSPWSFRSTPATTKHRHFRLAPDVEGSRDGVLVARPELRARIEFSHLAIQEHLSMLPRGSLDAVLFRNVAVYLRADALAQIYQGFSEVLRPGGLLLVSASDPRPTSARFRAGAEGDGTIYTRVEAAGDGVAAPPPKPAVATRPMAAAAPATATALEAASAPQGGVLQRAQWLADGGEYERALALCDEALPDGSLRPAAYRLRGQVRFHQGCFPEAIVDLERACALAPREPITRFWLALALQAQGHVAEATQQCDQVLEALGALEGPTRIAPGGTTARELAAAVEALRRTLT